MKNFIGTVQPYSWLIVALLSTPGRSKAEAISTHLIERITSPKMTVVAPTDIDAGVNCI